MHPLVRGLVAPLVLLWAGLAAAWAAGGPLEVQFRSVTVPMNSVPAVAQDQAGFMWVATSRGVMRYDGYRLRPIELPGGTNRQRNLGWVRAIAPDSAGHMWIGTETLGLARYDAAADRVELPGSPAGAGGPHAPIRALAVDAEGDVWVGSVGQGLYRYRAQQRRFEPQPLRVQGQDEARVLALRVAANGTVWAGHWRGLARLRPGQAWEQLRLPALDGLPEGGTVLALLETHGGRLWLGTQDGRLGVVEGDAVRWVQSLRTPVQALAEGPDGRLWVGTKTGLLWLNPGTEAVEARLTHDPRRPMGLAGNDISGVLRDRSGAMWVTGYGLGLQRHLFHPALAVRGPDPQPGGVLQDADVRAVLTLRSGEVLGATQQGQVVRLDGRRELQTLGLLARERRTVVEMMAEAGDGTLWMAAAGRLEHRSATGRLLRDWPLDGGRAQRLLVQASGAVWLGMQEGLYRLDGPGAPALQRVSLADGQPLHGAIHALIERPGGELWLGGQAGLYRVRDGRHPERLPQSPGEGLASPVVVALLCGRDGGLWVDTAVSGLHRLAGWDAQGRARFDRISERLGLEGAFGGNLHEDARGRVWTQLNVYDPRSDRVDHFGSAEGATAGSYWFFASTELPGGGLLFGGSRGLLRVLPEAFAPQLLSPPLVISGLRVNGQPHGPPGAGGLTLPAGTRSLAVEFAALDYADPARLRYQYRLLGLDDDWTRVDASARNPSFGPLKPGRYVLQVKASAHQTLWGTEQLELPVELLPAWWETTAAHVAGAMLALAAIWGWMRWRTRVLRRREAELQALVDERTAELRELSLTDALTGLRNRRYLELRLDDDLRLCLRRFETADGDGPGPDADLLLMLLDLDHFKRINDQHGHAAGDAVLVQLAERLRGVFRETDSLVRWGGEEMLVLVRETERRDAAALAARVCAAVREQPFDIGPGETVNVTASIGFSAFPLDPRHPRLWDWRACLALADSALYAAKAQGRDGYVGAMRSRGLSPREAPDTLSAWQCEARLEVARSAVDDPLTA
jgi:diguanylate cyclase (GGDEF)-like protein